MQANLEKCMPEVLKHEGGYVNHPKDPGGETNLGITHRTLQAARKSIPGLPASVRGLGIAQATKIYDRFYWQPTGGPDLPGGVDYVVLDAAINSGPARGVRWMQAAVGAKADGVMGPQSIAAAKSKDPVITVERACNNRRGFLRGLSTFNTFGKGWTRRVNEVEAFALRLATAPGAARATIAKRADQRVTAEVNRTAQAGAGGVAASGGTAAIDFSSIPDWAPWAIAVVGLALVVNQMGRFKGEKARAKIIKEAMA